MPFLYRILKSDSPGTVTPLDCWNIDGQPSIPLEDSWRPNEPGMIPVDHFLTIDEYVSQGMYNSRIRRSDI